MKKDIEIAGYTALPLTLPSTPSFPVPATHYLYLRPHEPRIPDPDTPRSLFLVNTPIDTTETHIRHLFGTQLASGRVERVDFESARAGKKSGAAQIALAQGSGTNVAKSKKRKRMTADELESKLDAVSLPSTWDRELQRSGSHAVVVFVDRASMEASLKAARRVARKASSSTSSSSSSSGITWGEGIEDRVPALGLQRYVAHQAACYPPRAELLRTVNEFMNVFGEVGEARKRDAARRAAEPDEDGFVTVTSGPRLTSAAGEEEAKRLVEKQKKSSEGFEDFYRFQSREKRKERQIDLLKKFDEDRKRLEEMKMRKGKIRVIRPRHGANRILQENLQTPTMNPTTPNQDISSGGGFMQPSLPSPAPSTSTATPSLLPKQRTHPLKAGSMKETSVINYVDKAILAINRRHAKKFSSVYERGESQGQNRTGNGNGHGNGNGSVPQSGQNGKESGDTGGDGEQEKENERGYESFKEVVKDIEGVVDVLWVSGTPSLQIPYLISLSVLVNSFLPSYPFAPKHVFRLLRKLDSFFAALLTGEDAETGQPLSGFEGRRSVVSMTEKVRIKSITEAARVGVVEAGERGDGDGDGNGDGDGFVDGDEDEESEEDDMDVDGVGPVPGRWEMETARVYEKTVQLLGDELGTSVEFCDEDMARGEGDNDIPAV